MSGYPIKPTFATNRADGSEIVAGSITSFWEWLISTRAAGVELAIATAYINPGGYSLLKGPIADATAVRLLIGAEPEPQVQRIRKLSEEATPPERALEAHDEAMTEDRNLLGFTRDADASAKHFVDWLESGQVEIRRFTDGFLHGKAYLVVTDDEGVIAGSSNFTYAGLARNHELNLGHYDPPTVAAVRAWFEEMWDASSPFDLAAVYKERFEPHSPYLIYLRMLYEKYGAEVAALAAAEGFGLQLAAFQKDGVTMAKMILARYGGVVIADGVGLGKTYIAGELIREAVEDRRQRVLVVAPAALRDGPWRAFKANQHFNFELISFDELSADKQINPETGTGNHLLHPLADYAMVVIDEAHAYRNPSTQRAAALNRLLEGSPPKALVLASATPVNNSLFDLYNLLAYFVRNDATFASVGIPSLRARFAEAAKTDPDALNPDQLFDVLSPVVVRRTRSYVKHYYPGVELTIGGVKQRVTFPTAEVLPVDYDIDVAMPGFLGRFASAIDIDGDDVPEDESVVMAQSARRNAGEEALILARYAPSAYRLDGEYAPYEGQVAGLLRSSLLKRFESSSKAFAKTCETMAASHDRFLDLLAEGVVATGDALKQLSASDSDDIDDLIAAAGDKWNTAPSSEYDVAKLTADVEADRDLLLTWAAEAHKVTADKDPKLAAVVETLADIAATAAADVGEDSTEGDRRKVIVFSYFADTVDWVTTHLKEVVKTDSRLAGFSGRVVSVNGSDHDNQQRAAMFGFAPKTTEAPPPADDMFDILVATDVLAEGVNLQQARNIINYDLPWNPMRLVQRHGRIDRIGSPHRKVFMHCVMPDKDLNALLQLEERLHAKIAQAAHSIGVESTIIPGSIVSDRSYTETRETLAEIARGEAGFLEEASGSLSVEELRQQLRQGLENPLYERDVKALAWGSGSGKAGGGETGFVFCARVGDHPDVQFRYVVMTDPAEPVVVSDVLASLSHAESMPVTPRVLSDETQQLAYDAWAAAKASILESWTYSTDPRNLQPEIPKAMRDAAEYVRSYAPEGMTLTEVDILVDTLSAPYPERVLRQVRSVLTDETLSAYEVSTALADLVRRNALTPPQPPEPLPVAGEDDVHLVCWLAITPSSAPTLAEQVGELPLGDKL